MGAFWRLRSGVERGMQCSNCTFDLDDDVRALNVLEVM